MIGVRPQMKSQASMMIMKSQARMVIGVASFFGCRAMALVARRYDIRVFRHQDHGASRSTDPMFETPARDEALSGSQGDGTLRQIEQELANARKWRKEHVQTRSIPGGVGFRANRRS